MMARKITLCCLLQLLVLMACGGDPAAGNSACDSLARDPCRSTAGCFLDYRAAIHRLGGKDLTDTALLDDRVVTTRQTRSRE